jgi:tetratricopeptide (TPR) repeat protein
MAPRPAWSARAAAGRAVAVLIAAGACSYVPPAFAQEPSNWARARAADLTAQAAHHVLRGDPGRAKVRLREAIGLDPTFGPAYLELARVHETSGDWAEALRTYEACVERLGAQLEVHRARARLLARMRRWDEAGAELQWAVWLAPSDPTVRDDLVELYVRASAWSAALQQARAVLLIEQTRGDPERVQAARVRVAALGLLAAETDPVRAGAHAPSPERRALARIGDRVGAL